MTVKVTEHSFQKEVYECRRPVLVEFYASWCPKCAMMEDVLQEFSVAHREIKVCRVNTRRRAPPGGSVRDRKSAVFRSL